MRTGWCRICGRRECGSPKHFRVELARAGALRCSICRTNDCSRASCFRQELVQRGLSPRRRPPMAGASVATINALDAAQLADRYRRDYTIPGSARILVGA
jgi:hypothetical protein